MLCRSKRQATTCACFPRLVQQLHFEIGRGAYRPLHSVWTPRIWRMRIRMLHSHPPRLDTGMETTTSTLTHTTERPPRSTVDSTSRRLRFRWSRALSAAASNNGQCISSCSRWSCRNGQASSRANPTTFKHIITRSSLCNPCQLHLLQLQSRRYPRGPDRRLERRSPMLTDDACASTMRSTPTRSRRRLEVGFHRCIVTKALLTFYSDLWSGTKVGNSDGLTIELY